MNSYASCLGGRDPIDVMRRTPDELQRLLNGISPDAMSAPTAPGKWSLREILAHLADCEVIWAARIRHVLETPGVTVIPFDQDAWATRYAVYPADLALQTFLTLRAWNLALLTTVTDAEKGNTVTHPERGTFPLSELLESIGGHDRNHIVRLEELLQRRA